MSDDFARATGSPLYVTINGKEYRVSKFTPRDIGDIQAWFKSEVPDPRVEARKFIEGIPDAVAIEVWKTAVEEARNWPPTLGDERSNDLLVASSEGVARLLWVTLRRHNGIDLPQARQLVDHLDIGDIAELIRLASPESADVPKASTASPATA